MTNQRILILSLCIAFGALLPAQLVAEGFKFDSPIGIVMKLYHDFAFRAVINQNNVPYDGLLSQPENVLKRYVDPTLARLILSDQACAVASGGICNIDYDPMYNGSDMTGMTVEIKETGRLDEIAVLLGYGVEPHSQQLIYKFS